MTLVERLHRTGLRRSGSKKSGLRYGTAGGEAMSREDRERIEALRLPPAWRDVAIASSPRAAVQAVGLDAAGRWQYRYHPAHERRREKKKEERLRRFGKALPAIRAAIVRDLSLPGLPREKVLACAVRLLSCCFLRPGSRVYAEENRSFGLTTLNRRHVSVSGDLVTLDFPGKSGKRQTRELRDRRIARIVKQLLASPGKLFSYRDPSGEKVEIRRRHVNDYIKASMGEAFSAKDFRTWAGTVFCACVLARGEADPGKSKTGRKKKIVQAIRETADSLGNTPAVCRSSYISPRVLEKFKEGEAIEPPTASPRMLVARRVPPLAPAEKAVLELLEDGEP
jgi:DNA topoisomerase I